MLIAAALLFAAAFAVAVWKRGWPSITVTVTDPATGDSDASEAEPVERTAAIGFALPVPEDDWEDGSEDSGRRRSAR